MKKLLCTLALTTLPFTIQADPAAFVGLSVTFGGDIGVTGKILSSDKEDQFVAAAGVTWYPAAEKPLGVDVSGGYNFDNVAALVGYDFLQKSPVGSVGWADTEDDRKKKKPCTDPLTCTGGF